jgi:putative DNA primase/helicase
MEKLESPVKAFIAGQCVMKAGASVSVNAMYQRWIDWCNEEGRKDPGTKGWFGRNLRAALPRLKKARLRKFGDGADNREHYYNGIALIPQTEAEQIGALYTRAGNQQHARVRKEAIQ